MISTKTRMAAAAALGCLALAFAAVLIHGYHLGTDDAAIWVPSIKKAADPALYPFGAEFFLTHAHFSLFPLLLGSAARLTHLPSDAVILGCHIACVFLLLLASWRLLSTCFEDARSRWAGVALLAGGLRVPVAGTALVIMDPYVTSRTLSTPLALFAIACYLSDRPRRALAWLAACALIHPQMSLYAAVLLGLMELGRRSAAARLAAPALGMLSLAWVPLPWDFAPARGPAREALLSRTYFFVSQWTWYEWVGVAAPLILLWCSARIRLKGTLPPLAGLLRNAFSYGVAFTVAGLLLVSSPRLENYTRLQPMRAFHLLYIIVFLLTGALAGQYLLKDRRWRWLALFGPLAAGMWLLAKADYPSSRHVEWPGATAQGKWYCAFVWVRDHTPKDAVFAMDPGYLLLPGEDLHGFRAIAERSALADRVKDSGAVSLFPQLAADWDQQVRAQSGWDNFTLRDFQKLARRYPVTWIVTRRSPSSLDCPYRDAGLTVCRLAADDPRNR